MKRILRWRPDEYLWSHKAGFRVLIVNVEGHLVGGFRVWPTRVVVTRDVDLRSASKVRIVVEDYESAGSEGSSGGRFSAIRVHVVDSRPELPEARITLSDLPRLDSDAPLVTSLRSTVGQFVKSR